VVSGRFLRLLSTDLEKGRFLAAIQDWATAAKGYEGEAREDHAMADLLAGVVAE
jgi:hypothetical protein